MRVRASLVCALLFGCSGAPIPPAPRAAEAPPPPRGPTVIHWGGIARGIEGGLAGRVAPDGERMTLGGWRVRVADGRVHVAETPLAGTIVATYRCGDGWLFRTSRDALAYAEDFVGAIRDVGVLPIGMFDEPILQNDHLAFVSRGGVAYQAPCGSPLRRVEPLAGETVEAVWARGRERRAVVGGAFLYVSEDEGRTWRVADGEVAIERVRFADDGRVGAGSTWLQLTEAGALVPAEAPPYAERREPLFSPHIIGSAQRLPARERRADAAPRDRRRAAEQPHGRAGRWHRGDTRGAALTRREPVPRRTLFGRRGRAAVRGLRRRGVRRSREHGRAGHRRARVGGRRARRARSQPRARCSRRASERRARCGSSTAPR